MKHRPNKNHLYVALSDSIVGHVGQYVDEYETPVSETLKSRSDVTPGCVATTDAQLIRSREGWQPTYLVIHFFASKQAYQEFHGAENTRAQRSARRRVARVDEVTFPLGALMKKSTWSEQNKQGQQSANPNPY